MTRLEDLSRGATVRGLTPGGLATILDVKWHGNTVVEVTYKDATGAPHNELLYRDDEARLELASEGRPWRFDADGHKLRLASEAQRIRLAHLFDPYLAVHTSLVEPLPHQITAVYENMLPRQPLRYLLADDPGAGKTIMTGLFVKELIIRGDLHRCLIVCPGSLVEQWQDELYRRFDLPFDILTNDRLEAARTGNVFAEIPLLIARLDKLARNDELIEKLAQTDWDLIVCDEAHKMSATFFGGEIKYTKRYRLGQRLSQLARHFLLLTATPHNGKEEDFQLFMALLDGDRFEGRFRDGVHTADTSDLMRRLVKEQLLKFDSRPLFPERRAYTVTYRLSDLEAKLYYAVTTYVREEFNRAENLGNDGRRGTVGFALTILQRRLASSPEAIYQSLKRRRERLERRLREELVLARGEAVVLQNEPSPLGRNGVNYFADDDWGDLEDAPAEEVEALEEELVDQATAARTIEELRIEIGLLQELETLAQRVLHSQTDRKWDELSRLLQNEAEMFDQALAGSGPHRRKLVIFTEHRDTLNYLAGRIRSLLGQPEAVVLIHGGLGREERRKAQEAFTQDKQVQILIATDAAGEGINLQRAHLMINYDLPWNPNRLEQRFGRIHRIGQLEVCHLWNLVAEETREGDVYLTLLRKLERERESLGGAVFDVLGKAIAGTELRQLMIEAIRYGDQPEVRARLSQAVEGALDRERLQDLLADRALARDVMDAGRVQSIRQEMERLEARRLQPHFIAAFFKDAFRQLGGVLREREQGRYEITHVPAVIRQRDRLIGRGEPVLPRYERICFQKELINVAGKPLAAFVCPGHPLLDATLDLVLERYRDLLKQGAILVDDNDPGETPRILFYLQHSIQDGRPVPFSNDGGGVRGGGRRIVSQQLQFVELPLPADGPKAESATGTTSSHENQPPPNLLLLGGGADFPPSRGDRGGYLQGSQIPKPAGSAPYLDYRPLKAEEQAVAAAAVEPLIGSQDWEGAAVGYAIEQLVPRHLREVRSIREPLIAKTTAAVKERLTKEIVYWDNRAEDLKLQEAAGKVNARLNSAKARQRADDLQARLRQRLTDLEQERQLAALPPLAIGGALVLPQGLLARLQGDRHSEPGAFARETKRVEDAAMATVMAAERRLGHQPRDVSRDNVGYDIESVATIDGEIKLRFIEVKGRISGAQTVTLTKNEILTGLNKPEDWILALVEVPLQEATPGDVHREQIREERAEYRTGVAPAACRVRYVRRPFTREPDFGVTSVNYNLKELWHQGTEPT